MTNIIQSSTFSNFVATLSGTISNVTGDGTIYTCVFNTLTQGSSSYFNTSTGIFTSIIPGNYFFDAFIDFGGIGTQAILAINFVTTSKTYNMVEASPSAVKGAAGAAGFNFSLMGIKMNANDTAKITLQVTGGSKTISFNVVSYFTGKRIS